jgi:beta-phosphoglucomutase
MTSSQIAVIFDFDGTIVNTVKCYETCWQEVLQSLGREVTREQFEKGLGLKSEQFVRDVLKIDEGRVDSVVAQKEALFRRKSASSSIEAIPETLDLIRRLHAAKIPLAIGSASGRATIDRLLGNYPDIYQMFSAFVTGDELIYGKPDPEVFLKAADRLGVLPSDCVVIEDTPLGIMAAKAAGMRAVAITTTLPADYLVPSHPDLIVSSLAELSVEDLLNLVVRTKRFH